MVHPIRKAEVHTFRRFEDTSKGHKWIAYFYPYSVYPVYFSGKTRQEVLNKAETMRAEAIEKHEADCIRRQELARRNKERAAERKRKKEAEGK